MRLHNIIAVTGSLVISLAFSAAAQKGAVKVDLSDGTGKSVGTAELSPAAQGVTIRLNLKDLTPGEHAIHVHTVAKCEGPAFTSAGPHLNPDMKPPAFQDAGEPYAGNSWNFPGAGGGGGSRAVGTSGRTRRGARSAVRTNRGRAVGRH